MPRTIDSWRSAHHLPWDQGMVRSGRVVLFCGLLALFAVAGGCQRRSTWNLASVEGTITKDGRPLRDIKVVFLADSDTDAKGPRSTGITDDAGHYRLRTDGGDEGVVIGKHRVLVFDLKESGRTFRYAMSRQPQRKTTLQPLSSQEGKRPEDPLKSTAKEAPLRVPRSYRSFNETLLRVEVQPGSQTLDFNLP